ncbi:hypothetical protein [Nocardioides taihuensis]|uniref:DUF222 domain-containing protein n=1 Tax=Nocardioides taihuensis TaxID=1835606 RepID=A0ABW0BIX5_9ACTN
MTTTTSDTDWGTVAHPVAAAVARLHAELDALVETPVWGLEGGQVRDTLGEVTRLAARVAELELRLVAHADRVGAGEGVGATTTGGWWAVATNQTRAVAHRRVKLAVALDGEHEPVGDALAEGRVLPEQAQVIVDAVDALSPVLVDPASGTRHAFT